MVIFATTQIYGFDKIDANVLPEKINSIVSVIVSLSRHLTPKVALMVMMICGVMLVLGGISSGLKKMAIAGILCCLFGVMLVYVAPVLLGFVMYLAK